jgi:hypothetical protein
MEMIRIGNVPVSRFILGSNPFSGFSHQGKDRDLEMVRHYTCARIKKVLHKAETLGINTIIGRTDHHVMRVLREYYDEGGGLQWFAQTCPGVGPSEMCIRRAMQMEAKACHVHGGVMDYLLAQNDTHEVQPAIDMIRKAGMLAGIAGHNVGVFEWAEKNLDCDYYLCCHYNPSPRDRNPEHVHDTQELYREEDRQAMTALIPRLSRPVIHYKLLAGGRNDPAEAFAFAARVMQPGDAACVGVYTGDDPKMLEKDVALFEKAMKSAKR